MSSINLIGNNPSLRRPVTLSINLIGNNPSLRRPVTLRPGSSGDSPYTSLGNLSLAQVVRENLQSLIPRRVWQSIGIGNIRIEELPSMVNNTVRISGANEEFNFQIEITEKLCALGQRSTLKIDILKFEDLTSFLDRSLLPGQQHPGVGGVRTFIENLIPLARAMGFQKLEISPLYYHNYEHYHRLGFRASEGEQAWIERKVEEARQAGNNDLQSISRYFEESGARFDNITLALPLTEFSPSQVQQRLPYTPIVVPPTAPQVSVVSPSASGNRDEFGAYTVDTYLAYSQQLLRSGQSPSWLLVNFDLRWVNNDISHKFGDQYLTAARKSVEEIARRHGVSGEVIIVREGPNFAVYLPEGANKEAILAEINETVFGQGIQMSVAQTQEGVIEAVETHGRALIFTLQVGQEYNISDLRFALRQAIRYANNGEHVGESYVANQVELASYRLEGRIGPLPVNFVAPGAAGRPAEMIESASRLPNYQALKYDLGQILSGQHPEYLPERSQPGAYLTVYRHGGGSDELYMLVEVVDAQGRSKWYLSSFDGNKFSSFRQFGLAGEAAIDAFMSFRLPRAAASAQGSTLEEILADFQQRANAPFEFRFTPAEQQAYGLPGEIVDLSQLSRSLSNGRTIEGFNFTGAVMEIPVDSQVAPENLIRQAREAADRAKKANPERTALFQVVDASQQVISEIRPSTLTPQNSLPSLLENCGLTELQATEIFELANQNGFRQIVIPEGMRGQNISYELLKEFVSRPRPEGSRILLIATPENFYSIGGAGFEELRVEVSQNAYRFVDGSGAEIASYRLSEGFKLEQVSNNGSALARRLERDISRQARQIELKIIGPFYQKLIANQQFANRVAGVLTEAGTLGIGLVGSHAVSAVLDEFGIQMPALRFVLEFGGFDLSARLFSRFVGLPTHNFAQGLPGLGQLHWGTTAYNLTLDAFGVAGDSILRSEIPTLGAGLLATRALFNRYIINPGGMLGRALARAGIYSMVNQVITESGVWLASRLTNGQSGQIFDETSLIAATQHPIAFNIGSYTIGRIYAGMLIDLLTDARADFERMMANATNQAETAAVALKDMLSMALITYCAAHPRSFGGVPEVPVVNFLGPATGTLDSTYYQGMIDAVRQAFANSQVQEITREIASVYNQHYGADTMNALMRYFNDSGLLIDPEGLVAWLKSENSTEISRIEDAQKDYFAYEMFIKMANGGDLTPYRNMGWIREDGEPMLEDAHVQEGLTMFLEEQRPALVERTAYLISRQNLGEELEYNPLDFLAGIITFKNGEVAINEEGNPYLEEARGLLSERGIESLDAEGVVETIISSIAFADPQDITAWFASLDLDQSSSTWIEALSRDNLAGLAQAQGQLGVSNLASKEAIGLYRMLYMYYQAEAPSSPILQVLEAYLPVIEGKAAP